MKNKKRSIVIAHRDRPSSWCNYKNDVWINIQDKNITDYIKAAIRMEPDELVIEKDCLHELFMTLQKENSMEKMLEDKMKIEKIITTNIEIKDITLLSIDEYKACKNIVPLIDNFWWLRSPGYGSFSAACVFSSGFVSGYGYVVDYDFNAVRPALIYESSDLKIGDKIKIVGYNWTVISDSMILCDDVVGQTCFKKNWKVDNANDYEKSDIKRWLYNWWKDVSN